MLSCLTDAERRKKVTAGLVSPIAVNLHRLTKNPRTLRDASAHPVHLFNSWEPAMTSQLRALVVSTMVGLPFTSFAAPQHPEMPAGMTHEQHMEQMKKEADMKQHGQLAMGFDQDKATHHFTLTATGGLIVLSANDAADQTTRDQIRRHLQEITQSFARGDFEKPLMTHGEMPPGVAGMQRHKNEITFSYEPGDRGASVRIVTANAEALEAVHDFLRYQIREHATGDAAVVQN
jgi:hypothetical protein